MPCGAVGFQRDFITFRARVRLRVRVRVGVRVRVSI